MLTRLASRTIGDRLAQFPAVVLVGPRQCGKTTLARTLSSTYFDLEQTSERLRLDLNWPSIAAASHTVILDEAQSWPEVFPRLRGAIDQQRDRNGRFLVLGSVSPALMSRVSESLAGRLAIVELSPLVLREVGVTRFDEIWRFGGFPGGGVLDSNAFPTWQDSYIALMAYRDLPLWGLPAKSVITERLFRMLAALHGGILNLTKLGQSLGLTHPTVASYLEFLEGAYLIRLLRPFEANLKKRLVKSPRVYWRDTGLLHAILGLSNNDDMFSMPWVGASWEGWVIEQIITTRRIRGERFQPYFFRSHDGHEVDLVIEKGGKLELIEIKLTTAPSQEDFSGLTKVAGLLGATRTVLISRTPSPQMQGSEWSVDLGTYLENCDESSSKTIGGNDINSFE